MRGAVAVGVGVGALLGVGALVWWLRRGGAEGGDVIELPAVTGPYLYNAQRAEGVKSAKIAALLSRLRVEGVPYDGQRYAVTVGIDGGVRTDETQRSLYAKGREQLPDGSWMIVDASKVVTNAQTASTSKHGRGLAVDLWVLLPSGAPLLFPKDAPGATSAQRDQFFNGVYAALGAIGKSMGLTWGGDWKSLVDRPHFEE